MVEWLLLNINLVLNWNNHIKVFLTFIVEEFTKFIYIVKSILDRFHWILNEILTILSSFIVWHDKFSFNYDSFINDSFIELLHFNLYLMELNYKLFLHMLHYLIVTLHFLCSFLFWWQVSTSICHLYQWWWILNDELHILILLKVFIVFFN
jgi:hypothetical protein